ncbi:MAG: chloramphenicol acetyltransferase [Pseudomonadota bacterium]
MPKLSADAPLIHADCFVENCSFGAFTEVGRGSVMLHSTLGDYSYCSRQCDFANARIGKFANIASNVRIGATDHPMDKASMHHFLYRSASYWDDIEDDADWFEARRARITTVGHDTWIGHAAMIKPEVTIGNGAVVGAGTIVTKDVPPYAVVVGNPGKVIRVRFTDDTIERLDALAWWNWDHDALRAALMDFRALKAKEFLEKYEI